MKQSMQNKSFFSLKRNKLDHESTLLTTHSTLRQDSNNSQKQNVLKKNKLSIKPTKKLQLATLTKQTSFQVAHYQQFNSSNKNIEVSINYNNIINSNILDDNKLSIAETQLRYQQLPYIQQKYRVQISSQIAMHPKVLDFYAKIKQLKKLTTVHFVQGLLPLCRYIYYGIEHYLILIQIQDNKIEDEVTIIDLAEDTSNRENQNIVITVKQVNIQNENIHQQFKGKVLLISHPWKACLYGYTIYEKIQLHALRITIPMYTQKVQFFEASNLNKIFYLEQNGELGLFTLEKSYDLGFFTTGKYSLKNYNSSILKLGIEQKLKRKTKSITKNIGYFLTNIFSNIKKLFYCQYQPINILYDERQNLIFTLSKVKTSQKINKSIKVYKIEQNAQNLIAIFDQNDLYDVCSYLLTQQISQFSIHQIQIADRYYYPEANLIIILKNLTKLLLQIREKDIKIIRRIYPPDYSALQGTPKQQISTKQSRLQFQQCKSIPAKKLIDTTIVAHYIQKGFEISIVKDSKQLSSFLISKQNSKNNGDIISEIKWKNMNDSKMDVPHDNLIYKLSNAYDKSITHLFIDSHFKTNQVSKLHALCKQVHYKPQNYLYCTQQHISFMKFLRPIDILFTILSKFNNASVCEDMLIKFYPKMLMKEICTMFIQIIVDKQGQYHISTRLNQEIDKNTKGLYEIQQNRKNIYHYNDIKNMSMIIQILDRRFCKNESIQRQKQSKQKSEVYNATNQSIFSYRQKNYNKQNAQIKKQTIIKLQSMMLYFSRIIRPIWYTHVEKLKFQGYDILIQKMTQFNLFVKQFLQKDAYFQNFIAFIEKNIQLQHLIKHIQIPSLIYEQALAKQVQYFEPYLFKTMHKYYHPYVISKWKQLFPMYITSHYLKIHAIYLEIKNEEDKDIIGRVFELVDQLPLYFINYLVKEKNFKQARAFKIQNFHGRLKQINIPKFENNIQAIQYILETVKTAKYHHQQKKYLLTHCNKLIKNEEKLSQTELHTQKLLNYKNYINNYQLCIHFQFLILQQYEMTGIQNNFTVQKDILQKLAYQLYDEAQLFILARQINSNPLLLIYYLLFESNSPEIGKVLFKICEKHQKKNWPQGIQNQLSYIIKNSFYKVPLKLFIQILDNFSYRNSLGNILNKLLSFKHLNNVSTKQYWVPQFLYYAGLERQIIYQSFIEIMSQHYNDIQFERQPGKKLLVWINCFLFVKGFFPDKIIPFKQFTQEYFINDEKMPFRRELIVGIQQMLSQLS